MHMVRKLIGRRPTLEGQALTGDEGLSLMHLRKLFMEFIHSSVPLTLKEQEKKLYTMLPLFNNVFSNAQGNEMTERFGDVLQFAAHTSRLMVNEIRRHAVNKSNDNASASIMNFLIKRPEDQPQLGWNLLNSLSILANGEKAIVECMIATQLPSTLVHCLYLFFELPPSSESNVMEEDHSTVQKLFIQLLVRLCNQGITAQELVRTDDLFILFTAMTCKCKPYNIGWRTGICEVLTSITRHGLKQDVCNYIHAKSCVSLCISSMRRIQSESPIEIVEMFIALFSILKDSTAITSMLMDDFRSCHGYLFLSEYLLQLGDMQEEAAIEACRNMVICVSSFTLVGFTPLRPPKSIGAPFQDCDFQIPEGTENGNTVRNIEAFHVLQVVLVKSNNSSLCQHILECIQRIYTSDQVNYFILEPQRTISTFIERVNEKESVVQKKVFELLEYVACNLNWTPSPELISLSILFKNTSVNSAWIYALGCLIQLVNYKAKYKNVFRDVGLLEVLTSCLKYYCVALKEQHNGEQPSRQYKQPVEVEIDRDLVPDEDTLTKYPDYPMLLMECLRVMVENSTENANMFRKCGGSSCLHDIVYFESARGEALKIVQQLILSGGRDDLGTLLGLLHNSNGTAVKMKVDILTTVIQVFQLDATTRALFREVGGFVYVMSVLMSMEGAFKNEPNSTFEHVERSELLGLFRSLFRVLTSAMQDEPANKTFFMDEVRYKGLADSLRLLGCFDSNVTSLPTNSPISAASLKKHLDRTVSLRSSIYVDPRVPNFHPQSSLFAALHVFHCLLDMAMDSFTPNTDNLVNDETDQGRVYPLDVSCIYHPGAITVLVELLASVNESEADKILHTDEKYLDALDLQLYVANRVQSCLRSERNQQVMCQAGLPQQILLHCEAALISEQHPLHLPIQRIFERLATQALTPVVLRDYVRLGHPLHCSTVEIHKETSKKETEVVNEQIDGTVENKLEKRNELNKVNNAQHSSSPASRDLHKTSLIADFNETLNETSMSTRNYFASVRSRSSSTSSTYSGDELLLGVDEGDEESVVGSPPDPKTSKRTRPRTKSKSKFYAPSPSSSFSGTSLDHQTSIEESMDTLLDPGMKLRQLPSGETVVVPSGVTQQPRNAPCDVTRMGEGDVSRDLVSGSACGLENDVKLKEQSNKNSTEMGSPGLTKTGASPESDQPVVTSPLSQESHFSPNESNTETASEQTNRPEETEQAENMIPSRDPVSEIASLEGGGPIPLSRVKCLVSMTTPRDMHLCGTTSLPGFVEFNMSSDGFGCLFFPSISPHVPQDIALVGSMAGVSSAMIGAVQGIGAGDRTFPPQAGVTFVAWVCIVRFSSQYEDPHPIRLLTISCKNKQPNGTLQDLTCLNIRISGMDRSLVISTDEELVGNSPVRKKFKSKNEARFPLDELKEGYWHHVVVTLNRALIAKNSTVTVYFDGSFIGTQKLRYIQTTLLSSLSFTPSSIDAYIGTRRSLRRCSKLMWQLGPCHFLEEPLQSAEVAVMYQLGPSYLGSFQAPFINKDCHSAERESRDPIVAEANIVFGLHAHATSLITMAKLKKHFSKTETKSVANELVLSKRDNSTPVRLMHNTASHLQGPSRCLGGVIVGISGVRSFFPRPVAELISCVGGTTTLLGLVAMANDVEMLYASVKALSCVLRHSFSAREDMERIKGYQILALLFKRKCLLLNTHILHLTFALVGTVDSEREMSVIPNHMAFKDLLCDFEVWTRAPDNLQKSLVAHFFELLSQTSQLSENVELMQELNVASKLFYVLKDETTPLSTIKVICEVLTLLLKHGTNNWNLLRFGQFLTWTITSNDQSEKNINISDIENSMSSTDGKIDSSEQRIGKRIILRNLLIEILLSLLGGGKEGQLNERFSLDIQETLGFDWILLFMKENMNFSTVVRALRLLVVILSGNSALERFREGSCNGGWLKGIEILSSKTVHVVAGYNVKATTSDDSNCEVNKNVVNVPGFVTLNELLSKHVEVPEIYHLVISLLLKHPVADVDAGKQFDWDSLYDVFWVSSSCTSNSSPPPSPQGPEKRTIYCAEAASLLLSMARMVCAKEWENSEQGSWLLEYPVTVVQFLTFLYHNVDQFSVVSSSQYFVEHLVAIAFPQEKPVRIVSAGESTLELLSKPPRGSIVYCNDQKESLILHPAKRHTMNLIRDLMTDALTTPPFLKAVDLVDLIVESVPSNSKIHQIKEFQTEVLHSQMEYLLAGNLLANPGKVMASIFSFISRVVDKLWQDHFNLGYKPIFNFIISLINASKGHMPKDGVFYSLNRVILYQLSRQLKELTDFTEMLEFLHLLSANYRIVFSPVNNDGDFIGGLCYWLLIMTGATLPETVDSIDNKYGVPNAEAIAGPQDLSHSSALLTAAAERVWERFIHSKREIIENVFKIEFPKSSFTRYGTDDVVTIPKNFKTMNLDPKSLGATLLEPAKKIWDNFHISQIRHKIDSPKGQQKSLRKPTMSRLGRRTKKEKTVEAVAFVNNSGMWTVQHIDLVKKLFQQQHRNHLQNYKLIERSISQEWSSREDDLTRVRGLWGPPCGSRLDKWMLDMVEGPCRMRKKMCQNDDFYDHYNFKPEVAEPGKKPSKFKQPMSFDSKLYAMLTNQKISALENNVENKEERSINDMQASGSTECDEVEASENNEVDDQTIIKLLEAGEKIRSMYRCARLEGLDHAEGLFLFGQANFYVVDGVTMLSTKEIKDIDSIPPEAHDPIIPRSSHDSHRSSYKKICSTWAYEAVREVHKRRYLLQETGLEVFSSDGRNHFLVFPKSVRNKVYNTMLSMITSTTDSILGMKPGTELETGLGFINTLMGEKSVTQRWERGEISNFQYLMYLNTLAGRSYNDLMQYPVFPWIIADYDSEELDLTNPATFRDLSKPMGAQTESRRKDFEKRYREWDDPNGETPPCHYATHYSSAMVVASYLVRMEPFAQHFLRLQDGHFDLPDRMFHSVSDAWLSASETNMADVKELIPEFFYLPEFLLNENRFDLGKKQSGVVLGDVVLPPWAKGDAREFIRLHRKALECDYVSSRLHEWIDLIFGYKQLGPAAVEAVNVFHHWFYEGSADISNIQDPLRRNATIGFINNFGQTPKQLFKKPHVTKRAFLVQDLEQSGPSFIINADRIFSNFAKLVPSTQPVKEIKGPVGQILQSDRGILAVRKNHALFPPPCNKYVAWGFGDLSLRIGQLDSDKIISVIEDFQVGHVLCAACPDARTLITGGTNTLVYVWIVVRENVKDKRPQLVIHEVLYGHLQPVTCLAVSSSYNLIVSGSEDMTCIIWDLNKLIYVRQLRGHASAISTISINNLTGDIVTCAGTYLYLWSVNGQLIVEENTSMHPSNTIHCCAMSEITEWDEDVILTGDQRGVVQMWTVEYFKEYPKPSFRSPSRLDSIETDRGSADSQSRDTRNEEENGGTTCNDGSNTQNDSELSHSYGQECIARSFSDDYVIIDKSKADHQETEIKTEPLGQWKRRLVMRAKLTMHTAFSRRDNHSPAAVTAMLISKDHKKLFVGDARGRVYSWSVSDGPGRIADHWVKDGSSPDCTACHVKFSITERKHHCRDCGSLFCSKCSDYESKIIRLGIRTPVRVCFRCYANLKMASKSKR